MIDNDVYHFNPHPLNPTPPHAGPPHPPQPNPEAHPTPMLWGLQTIATGT